MVKEILISDIELRLAGGIISDDFKVSRRQIGHWLDVIRDRLVRAEIQETQEVSPELWDADRNLVIESEDVDNEELSRYYVTLSKTPLSVIGDRAIVRVETTDLETVYKTSLAEVPYLKRLHFAKPTQTNLVYYRSGNKLYIEGATNRIASDYDVHAYYVASYVSNPPEEDEEFKITGALVPMLLDLVEETARRESQTEQDLENDGR